MNTTNQDIDNILRKYRTITLLGLSPNPERISYRVAQYMTSQGYTIIGVRPALRNDPKSPFRFFDRLADVPVDDRRFINVFRATEHLPEVVEEVLAVAGVEVLWFQLGLIHPEAERLAESKGLKVVSDRCLHIEHQRMLKS